MKLLQGDCLEKMKELEDNSIDTIITDPPYGLEFMGKNWDRGVPGIPFWEEMLRVSKPGATLLSFGGTRTYHRMACAIEDAGWVIKDCIMYMYGSGFPKSHNIEKALTKKYGYGNMETYEKTTEPKTQYNLRLVSKADLSQTINLKKEQGKVLQSGLSEQSLSIKSLQFSNKIRERQSSLEGRHNIKTSQRELQRCKVCQMSEKVVENGEERWVCNGTPFGYGTETWQDTPKNRSCPSYRPQSNKQRHKQSDAISDKPSSQEIREWKGWGSALKPAYEPIIVAVKPNDGTYANNALKWGVSGLNIDGGRIGTTGARNNGNSKGTIGSNSIGKYGKAIKMDYNKGRFPANIILDEEAGKMLDEQSGESKGGKTYNYSGDKEYQVKGFLPDNKPNSPSNRGDKGGASRFFYCAKASKSERNMGCEGLEEKDGGCLEGNNDMKRDRKIGAEPDKKVEPTKNNHPTVKPLALMEYLCILTKTPTGGIVLDPFMGSGTTGIACKKTGRDFIGIEKEEEYIKIAEARIKAVQETLFSS